MKQQIKYGGNNVNFQMFFNTLSFIVCHKHEQKTDFKKLMP